MSDVVLITGASSGIGLEIARHYSKTAKVLILVGRNQNKLDKAKDELICEEDIEVIVGSFDVSDSCDFIDWLMDIDEKYVIDLLVVSASEMLPIEVQNSYEKTFDSNVFGTFNTVVPVIDRMKSRKSGKIAIINSFVSFCAIPDIAANDNKGTGVAFSIYSASKRAIFYWALSLRDELYVNGISLSLICPGFVDTPMLAPYEHLFNNKNVNKFIVDPANLANIVQKAVESEKFLTFAPRYLSVISFVYSFVPIRFSAFFMSYFLKTNNYLRSVKNVKNNIAINPKNVWIYASSIISSAIAKEYSSSGSNIFIYAHESSSIDFESLINDCASLDANVTKEDKNIEQSLLNFLNLSSPELIFFDLPFFEDKNLLSENKKMINNSFAILMKIVEFCSLRYKGKNTLQIVVNIPVCSFEKAYFAANVHASLSYCESKHIELVSKGILLSISMPAFSESKLSKLSWMRKYSNRDQKWISRCSCSLKRMIANGNFFCDYPFSHYLLRIAQSFVPMRLLKMFLNKFIKADF